MRTLFPVLLVLLAGCSSASSYCNNYVDCVAGTDADVDTCIDTFDTEAEQAAEMGCSSERNALIDCISENATCVEGVYTSGLTCVEEYDAFQACLPPVAVG